MPRINKADQIKHLNLQLINIRANLDSYQTRNKYIERELAESNAKIKQMEIEIRWYKQLSQNLSEAVCAYMRNR